VAVRRPHPLVKSRFILITAPLASLLAFRAAQSVGLEQGQLLAYAENVELPTTSGSSSAAGASTKTGSEKPQVKLLGAGEEPRKALRFGLHAGDTQTLEMTVKMDMGVIIGQQQSQAKTLCPLTKMTANVRVKEVSKGETDCEMVVSDVRLADEQATTPPMAEKFAELQGLSGTFKISDRGFRTWAAMGASPSADPQARQVVKAMTDALSSFAPAFPEEPVGAGAKWEVKSPLSWQGMTTVETETCELVSLDPDRLQGSISMAISQSSTNFNVRNPATPWLTLTNVAGSSAVRLTFDLRKPLPLAGTLEGHSEIVAIMERGEQKQIVTTKVGFSFQIRGK